MWTSIFRRKPRTWVSGPSPVTTAALNSQSGVHSEPWRSETERSNYLTSYLNNKFHFTKTKKTTASYGLSKSVATFFKQNLMFANLYIFECGACDDSFPFSWKGSVRVCVCDHSLKGCGCRHQTPCLSVKEHKSLYVDRWICIDFSHVCQGFDKENLFWHNRSVPKTIIKTHGSSNPFQRTLSTRTVRCWDHIYLVVLMKCSEMSMRFLFFFLFFFLFQTHFHKFSETWFVTICTALTFTQSLCLPLNLSAVLPTVYVLYVWVYIYTRALRPVEYS